MTTLRSETRRTLQWCLEQPGQFRSPQIVSALGLDPVVACVHLRKFMGLGLIVRSGKSNKYYWTVLDRETAETLANEQPGRPNGYRTVAERKATRKTWAGANSVFSMGAFQ